MIRRIGLTAALLLVLSAFAITQAQSDCETAAAQAAVELAAAREALAEGSTDDADARIEAAQNLLASCHVETAATEENVTEETPSPDTDTTASPTAPEGDFVLSPPPVNQSGALAFLRFAHTSIDSGPVDLYLGGSQRLIVENLAYGDATPLMPINAGQYTIRARPAGSGQGGEELYAMTWNYTGNTTWIVTAAGSVDKFAFIVEPVSIVRNNYNDQARIRVVNFVEHQPRITVTTADGRSLGDGLGWIGIRDTLISGGEYALNVTGPGGETLVENYAVNVANNTTLTLYIIGQIGAEPAVSVLPIATPQNTTRVRFISERSDTVDIHARPGNERLIANLTSGTTTEFIELASGAWTFIAYLPDTGPTGQEQAAIPLHLRPGRDVTVIIDNGGMRVTESILTPTFTDEGGRG